MTDLSPAQKALAAFNNCFFERYELCGPFDDDWAEQCLAVALETAVDQVVQERQEPAEPPGYGAGLEPPHYVAQWTCWNLRQKLLAIANELRGDTTATTQENNQ